ncbi:MAG TPA: MlaD family protein, partial [Gammaproteobacteria bacterium]|nr:MlaD family protein [Gammaproteobacteria bacterium]
TGENNMESRVSYAAVGAFVLILSAALIGLGLWLGSDVTVQRYDRYSIYFTESVSGLYVNAPVKYRGVVVGRVEKMELAHQNPEQVHVVIAVQKGTPIKTDTRAKLDPQGVTGVVYIELTGGTRQAPLLSNVSDKPYPVIESEPSLFSRLDEALTNGLNTLDALAAQITRVLSEENQQSLQQTLTNLAQFSGVLAANSQRLENALASTELLLANGAAATAALPETLDKLDQTLNRWAKLADRLDQVGIELKEVAASGRRDLEEVGRTTIPGVNGLIAELQVLTDNLSRLSEDLRDNPQILLFGRPRAEPGPGE